MMPTLLVVDDDPEVLYSMERSLNSDSLRVVAASTAQEGIALVRDRRPDAVVLDVRLPDMSGLDAVDAIRQIDPHLPIVVITAFAATDTAIEAMKRGAFEYLLKPVDLQQLRDTVAQAVNLSRLRHVPAVFEETSPDENVDRIVGRCPAMQAVYKAIGRVATLDVTVLVLGESGTGKELVARALYHHSRRNRGPFLTLNCAAIPDALLESELFGHERGAFTGADRRRIGKFEQAHHGTLFLDEIGDLSLPTQAKLLRLLQERVLTRHTWPGNVRELENVVRHALIHAAGDTLTTDLLPRELVGNTVESAPPASLEVAQRLRELLRAGEADVYRRLCLEVDRVVVDIALQHTGGNQVLASQLLGMSRNTLRAKLRTLGLSLQKQLLSESPLDAPDLDSRPNAELSEPPSADLARAAEAQRVDRSDGGRSKRS